MERIAGDVEGVHFGVADLDAVFIGSLVERASDLEARLCRRRADEFDDGDTIRQRPAAPVPRFAYCSGRPKWTAARVGPLQFRARGVTEGGRVCLAWALDWR